MEVYELLPFPLPAGGECVLYLLNGRIYAKDFHLSRQRYHFTYPSSDLSTLINDLRLTRYALRTTPELQRYQEHLGCISLATPITVTGSHLCRTVYTHRDLYELLGTENDLQRDDYHGLKLIMH